MTDRFSSVRPLQEEEREEAPMTFVEACLAGVATVHDVDGWISRWRNTAQALPLFDFLGLTLEEYKRFTMHPQELATIIRQKKKEVPTTDDRPSFDEIYMGMAFMLARRSTCLRKSGVDGHPMRVGCVITTFDRRRVVAIGYNGNASGLPNRCDDPDAPGACGDLHAEENATISCTEPRATEKVLYSTHLPCVMCAKRIIQLGGVKKVFYAKPYRVTKSLDLFDTVGIECVQLNVGSGGESP
jgi:dCMP deaminase